MEFKAGTEMVKRSRRDDLQSTNFNQMTTSNITASASNNKGLMAAIGATALSIVLPLGLVLGAVAMNAPNAEAFTTTRCTTFGNTVRCTTY